MLQYNSCTEMTILFIQNNDTFQLIEIILLSGVKFFFGPALSLKFGYSYFQTIITTTIGGSLGVFFFYYLSEYLIKQFNKYRLILKKTVSRKAKNHKRKRIRLIKKKQKKNFSRKNKLIITTKQKYGLWGIAFLTPVLLSIPVGTFLASRYYKNKKNIFIYLITSIICWSFIISSIYVYFNLKLL